MTSRAIFNNNCTAPGESSVANMSTFGDDLSNKQAGPDSRLAMNMSKMPGQMFGRPIVPVETPDGTVNAITMSDHAIDIHAGIARNPGYTTPNHVYSWAYSTSWTSDASGTNIPLVTSPRVHAYRDFFYYYHCGMLVKLVCKMPLDRSDRFYVNWSDKQTGANSTVGIGFEWAPVEKNEIFVLLPWSAVYPMATPDADMSDLFGNLNISTIGSNGQSVIVDIYSCPVQQTLYNLRPVKQAPEGFIASNGTKIPPGAYNVAVSGKLVNDAKASIPGQGTIVTIVENTTNSYMETVFASTLPFVVPEEGELFITQSTYGDLKLLFSPVTSTVSTAEEQMDIEQPGEHTSDVEMTDLTGHTPDIAPRTNPNPVIYGKNTTESVRETNQRYLVSTLNIADATPQEFTFTLPEELLVNYARHQIWTKYPALKFCGTQTIQNPARYRIIQLPQVNSLVVSGDQFFELPGIEWDPKEGDLDLTPYWDRANTAFYYDNSQTLQQNFLSFLPKFYAQPINNFGNTVPINVFASVDHSSYHAIRDLTLSSSTAEEQMRFDGLKHCCPHACSLTSKRVWGDINCEMCNSALECKCKCLTFLNTNLRLYGHHFAPYVTKDTKDLVKHAYWDSLAEENRYIVIYKGYEDISSLVDRTDEVEIRDNLRCALAEINKKIHADIALAHGKVYTPKLVDVLYFPWEYSPPELQTRPSESTVQPTAEEQMDVQESADYQTPGNQFQTPLRSLPMDEGANAVAKTYAFVESFELEVTEADPTPSVAIPINANTFGPYVRQEARRHRNWRGNLKFKVLFNTPRTVAGAGTIAHLDQKPATQPSQFVLRQFPHQTTMDNSEAEIMCGWRKENPWVSRSGNNGYLYITFNGAQFGTTSNTVRITIYVDASGIEFSRSTPLSALPSATTYFIPSQLSKPLKDVSLEAVAHSLAEVEATESDIQLFHEAGLYFNGTAMECPTCHLQIGMWEIEDNPLADHLKHAGQKRTRCSLAKQRLRSGADLTRTLSLKAIRELNQILMDSRM
ncbi:hypothetical protein 2 [Beihai picorna-like virus 114]|uniref:hypothetical protein 2 n=1 Tax=Beihai picorna-like virus 114 TaxID=1922543 RepID=UPI00090B505C|nr:hypothetical protein 2 [Beihai picorna-like virus 114]APG78959.1 hypothetical protein 2 [Beihai picorna-like virus 114]